MDERQQKLKTAIAKCFAAHEAVTPTAVKSHLPDDFYTAGDPLTENEIFEEIQTAFNAMQKPALIMSENPDGHPLAHQLQPDPVAMPVNAAPPTQASASHAAGAPGLSPQARLNAAYRRQGDLMGARGRLQNAYVNARQALELAKQAWARHDPNRTTPEQEAARFREQSQRDRAARKGAYRLTPTAPTPRGEIAFVDLERKYSQGGDADTFVRRQNRTGNKHGAMSLANSMRVSGTGLVDKTGRPIPVTPAPVQVAKPTIPALAK